MMLVLCILLDGVAPHVDEAGAGGAPWYRRHSSTSLGGLRAPLHPKACDVGGQSVVLHPIHDQQCKVTLRKQQSFQILNAPKVHGVHKYFCHQNFLF